MCYAAGKGAEGLASSIVPKSIQDRLASIIAEIDRTGHAEMLVEQGLALYLDFGSTPTDGYRLAVDACKHYESRFGTDLNGPSRDRLLALAGFLTAVEARERAG